MNGKIFVGGPMLHAIRHHGRFHEPSRKTIAGILSAIEQAGLEVLSAHRVEDWGQLALSNDAHFDVCGRDFGWMMECRAFVAVLPPDDHGEPMRSDGTCVELGWASALQKPVVIVREDSPRHSHLVRGLSKITRVKELAYDEVVKNPSTIQQALETILGGDLGQQGPRRSATGVLSLSR